MVKRMTRPVALTFAAGAALVAALTTTGCAAVDKAMDCVRAADTIAGQVDDLQRSVEQVSDDPTQLDTSLTEIDGTLTDLGDKTSDADVSQAVENLKEAVGNMQTAVAEGDTSPDMTPLRDAVGELTNVCTP
ncbi:hypothetical protein SUDANB171_00769 [Streptomyces sp. enrichment culture]|jgi:carbonic anhydrase